ncbi:hypothetical protein AK812_SmicGene1195 [Symbiodinium microadriaticum]|uniref:Uncharacterized protein n=1 Tax=Symbiodinium microadriaticum TaxID=2951 RepID=A0A1Q9F4R5_SYMMI|nr:hypothetical protein AK812_SmicGene1195 [Symbiodinium microadriaticum]CAE7886974.1 unnamed protein product [Symbiodinium microadriaticum]CAE7943093.1 unnamed protein product [Symbiodinium sp. KB8]
MVCVGDADRDDSMGKDAPEHPEDEDAECVSSGIQNYVVQMLLRFRAEKEAECAEDDEDKDFKLDPATFTFLDFGESDKTWANRDARRARSLASYILRLSRRSPRIQDLDEATGAQDVELDDEGDADAGSDHDMVAREQVTLNLGPKFEEVASVSVSWQPLL